MAIYLPWFEGEFRNQVDKINLFQVRNNQGAMVPLGTICTAHEIGGPVMVTRYNLYTAAAITGNLQNGLEFLAKPSRRSISWPAAALPLSMRADWTELMFMQKQAGNTSMRVFARCR